MVRVFRMTAAFDGTSFHGWQQQPRGLRTVQEVIESSLRRVLRHPVQLHGCGRTDSGVHAAGHVSHFETTCPLPPARLKHAIGSRLAWDISIVSLREAHPGFHARRDAVSKLYRYCVFSSPDRPVERRVDRFRYHVWKPLDVQRMKAAARHLVGEKDFSAMAASGCVRETMVRTVLRCEIERHLDDIRIDVEGTGFLHKQVRNMVGTLIKVGLGQWDPDHVASIIESRDRTLAGPTAPARGLSLQWVRYPADRLSCPDRITG